MGIESTVSTRRLDVRACKLAVFAAFIPALAWGQEFPNIEPGHWYEVPDSKLSSVGYSPSPGGKLQNIINAWSGGALDTKRKQFLVWGGGHSDYAGNEVYAFDLVGLKWKRLSNPTTAPDDSKAATYPDGQPRARHTYNYIEYVPSIDRFVSFGGSAPWPRGGGGFTRQISEFDFDKATWVTGARASVPNFGGYYSMARLDPVSGDVFYVPNGNGYVQRYSPAKDEWTQWSSTNTAIHSTIAVDPVRRLLVLVGANTGYTPRQAFMWSIDRKDPRVKLVELTTGDTTIESTNAPGFDFHQPSGMFVGWREAKYLYLLNPDTWEWTRVDPPAASADPGAPAVRGTYGRFRYYPDKDVFVLVNGVDRNVFLYRPGWSKSDTGPKIDIKATAMVVEPGQPATISWSSVGAKTCAAEGAWSGTRSLVGSEQVGPLDQSATFALRCTDDKGFSSVRQVSIAVDTSGTLAAVDLTVDRVTISSGEYVNLSWQTDNAEACTASGDWSGQRLSQGSEAVGPVTESRQFTLTCVGPVGAVSDTAQVTLASAPIISLSSAPSTVSGGESSKLEWKAQYATNCMADGDWYGPKPLDGAESTSPILNDSTFELTCDGPGGSTSQKVQVTLAVEKSQPASGVQQDTAGGGALDPGMAGLLLALAAAVRRSRLNA